MRLRLSLNWPLGLSLVPVSILFIILFSRIWAPIHDTFQVTHLAYFFFNEFAAHGDVALWLPYLNYGIDTNWYLQITMGPSLWLLLPFAKIFSHASFLTFFAYA